ncbi:LysR family transcriptional regulator [uncultured Paracoccus sp.]|uniref:LysR substrate-binding domain-containing protein n=1 Tax=uncultured Paracoccus sp. TaxID=189685 RepID=UPI00262B8535|nr:LysR family transcriptional regulator [uncultured Paracoccus sp.]
MSLPPLNALRAFEAVARTGSFRAAAEALFVTQPAISHQVKHLEDWIGAPLFDRSGRLPQLNVRGMALARDLSAALESIDAACRRAQPRTDDEVLVVAAIPSVAICWLIPRLPAFRARHPKVPLRIIYAHHGEEIDFTEVDLAFVFASAMPVGQGFAARLFLPGDSIPVCSPSLLSAGGPLPHDPAAILQLGLLHDTGKTGWRDWLGKAGMQPQTDLPGAIFEDFNLLRVAALSGQGVALCPRAMIGPDLDQGRLVALSDLAVLQDHAYYLTISNLTPQRGRLARARDLFQAWLAHEQAGPPEQVAGQGITR